MGISELVIDASTANTEGQRRLCKSLCDVVVNRLNITDEELTINTACELLRLLIKVDHAEELHDDSLYMMLHALSARIESGILEFVMDSPEFRRDILSWGIRGAAIWLSCDSGHHFSALPARSSFRRNLMYLRNMTSANLTSFMSEEVDDFYTCHRNVYNVKKLVQFYVRCGETCTIASILLQLLQRCYMEDSPEISDMFEVVIYFLTFVQEENLDGDQSSNLSKLIQHLGAYVEEHMKDSKQFLTDDLNFYKQELMVYDLPKLKLYQDSPITDLIDMIGLREVPTWEWVHLGRRVKMARGELNEKDWDSLKAHAVLHSQYICLYYDIVQDSTHRLFSNHVEMFMQQLASQWDNAALISFNELLGIYNQDILNAEDKTRLLPLVIGCVADVVSLVSGLPSETSKHILTFLTQHRLYSTERPLSAIHEQKLISIGSYIRRFDIRGIQFVEMTDHLPMSIETSFSAILKNNTYGTKDVGNTNKKYNYFKSTYLPLVNTYLETSCSCILFPDETELLGVHYTEALRDILGRESVISATIVEYINYLVDLSVLHYPNFLRKGVFSQEEVKKDISDKWRNNVLAQFYSAFTDGICTLLEYHVFGSDSNSSSRKLLRILFVLLDMIDVRVGADKLVPVAPVDNNPLSQIDSLPQASFRVEKSHDPVISIRLMNKLVDEIYEFVEDRLSNMDTATTLLSETRISECLSGARAYAKAIARSQREFEWLVDCLSARISRLEQLVSGINSIIKCIIVE